MRETRVTIFSGAPVTVNSDTTTTGDTIDLKDNYAGNYFEGAPNGYGVGVELLFSSITGTRIDVDAYWEDSDDGTTWYAKDKIFADADIVALSSDGTGKLALPTRLVGARRYARIVVVTTNTNSASFTLNAWVSDATNPYGKATQPRI